MLLPPATAKPFPQHGAWWSRAAAAVISSVPLSADDAAFPQLRPRCKAVSAGHRQRPPPASAQLHSDSGGAGGGCRAGLAGSAWHRRGDSCALHRLADQLPDVSVTLLPLPATSAREQAAEAGAAQAFEGRRRLRRRLQIWESSSEYGKGFIAHSARPGLDLEQTTELQCAAWKMSAYA